MNEISLIKISELPNLGNTQLDSTDVVAGVVDGETVKVPLGRIASLVTPTDVVGADEFEQLWDAAP